MRKTKELSFIVDKNKKSKRIKSFIISFCAFVVVLGSISLLMFMKHLNFDFNNLFSSAETTAQSSTETTTVPVSLEGSSRILLLCEDTDRNLRFAFLLSTDYKNTEMKVGAVSLSETAEYDSHSGTLAELYGKYGAVGVRDALTGRYGISIDRYIKFSEGQFKKFLSTVGDVTVDVYQDIDDRGASGLILNGGEQSLSSDLFVKYLNYCDGEHSAEAFADFIRLVFDEKHILSLEKLFSFIANNSDTDITIVDFKSEEEKLKALSQSGLKVTGVGEIGVTNEVTDVEKD